jgi:hypothetical protein
MVWYELNDLAQDRERSCEHSSEPSSLIRINVLLDCVHHNVSETGFVPDLRCIKLYTFILIISPSSEPFRVYFVYFYFTFKNTTFRRLDSVSVFKWNLLRWAQ